MLEVKMRNMFSAGVGVGRRILEVKIFLQVHGKSNPVKRVRHHPVGMLD
jgi:hypothetical protein